MEYVPRLMDDYLSRLLETTSGILIQGPKWCGKTTTAMRVSKSSLMLGDTGVLTQARQIADIEPARLLSGAVPRLIDEWQVLPSLWDSVRSELDNRGVPGQFILTGSATTQAKVLHSGAGRILRVPMRTMTLYESGNSDGSVSLNDLFGGDEASGNSDMTLERMAKLITVGGWPSAMKMTERDAVRMVNGYIDAVAESELRMTDGVRRNPEHVRKIIRSIARNTSTTASVSTIRRDVEKHQTILSDKTVSAYISALRGVFVVENLPAWDAEMRTKAVIRTAPKRYVSDPSLAVAVMGASASGLMSEMSTFGLLFENLCIRDLRVYAQMLDGQVYYYRNNNGLEVDAVIQLWDGRWGAVEIKLGQTSVEAGVKNLLKLREIVSKPPEFMMVLTLNGYSYRRPDGVYVVPIGCLRNRSSPYAFG